MADDAAHSASAMPMTTWTPSPRAGGLRNLRELLLEQLADLVRHGSTEGVEVPSDIVGRGDEAVDRDDGCERWRQREQSEERDAAGDEDKVVVAGLLLHPLDNVLPSASGDRVRSGRIPPTVVAMRPHSIVLFGQVDVAVSSRLVHDMPSAVRGRRCQNYPSHRSK